ncbi:WG repeat-containing protein [Chryseobacterium artocarpi]|uniref:WG repeat-containing protein n=1 Tax=Chryseobacterium artocarpi TaxID=1414727 RepID=UPI003F2A7050
MKFIFSRKFTFFSLSLLSISAYAQELYIPYRDGNLWGISNYAGSEIITPKFDSLQLNEQDHYDFNLLHTFKDEKRGMLLNGKEVLLPEFKNIFPTYKGFIIAEYGNDKKSRIILDKDGTKITENPILSMWIGEKYGRNFIFHVLNENMKEDFFVWDPKEHKISQYLFKDYYSISILENIDDYELGIRYRKNETDPLSEVKMVMNYNKLEPATSKNFNEKIVKDTYRNRDYFGSTYQETIKQPSVVYEVYKDYDEGVRAPSYTPPPPSTGKRETNDPGVKKQPIYVGVSYSIENDFPYINYHYNHVKNEKTTKRLKLPRGSKGIKIESLSGLPQKKVGDTIYTYSNYMTFTHKDRNQILISEKKPTEFETIKVINPGYDSQYNGQVFLLGSKKNGKMKYRLVNNLQQMIFTDEFDDVILNDPFYSNNYSNWTVIKDEKYGVVTPQGKYILQPVYDEIVNKKITYGPGGFLQIKKDGKYGLLKPVIPNGSIENNLVEPVFSYPIRNILMSYPYRSSQYTSDGTPQGTMMIVLEDEKGKLLGFANKLGQLYFKN